VPSHAEDNLLGCVAHFSRWVSRTAKRLRISRRSLRAMLLGNIFEIEIPGLAAPRPLCLVFEPGDEIVFIERCVARSVHHHSRPTLGQPVNVDARILGRELAIGDDRWGELAEAEAEVQVLAVPQYPELSAAVAKGAQCGRVIGEETAGATTFASEYEMHAHGTAVFGAGIMGRQAHHSTNSSPTRKSSSGSGSSGRSGGGPRKHPGFFGKRPVTAVPLAPRHR